MMRIALAILLLVASAAAQDEDVYKTLALGDRVQITFRNGNTITGNLVTLPSAQAGTPDGPKGKPGAATFGLLFFRGREDASRTQEDFVQRWMGRHPEGKVEALDPEAQADAWKAHGIGATPVLIFIDRTAGRSLKLPPGLRTESELTEALHQFRATAPSAAAAIDYTREDALTIDLSWEYPGLTGSMTVLKNQIRSVRRLQALKKEELEALARVKKEIAEQLKRDDEDRLAGEEARQQQALKEAEERKKREGAGAEDELDKNIKASERMKRALEVFRRFPPPEWGPEKIKEIQGRTLRKQPIPTEEREFLERYDEWVMAREYHEKNKAGKEEKKTEEEKPAPPPPPNKEEKPPEEKSP